MTKFYKPGPKQNRTRLLRTNNIFPKQRKELNTSITDAHIKNDNKQKLTITYFKLITDVIHITMRLKKKSAHLNVYTCISPEIDYFFISNYLRNVYVSNNCM